MAIAPASFSGGAVCALAAQVIPKPRIAVSRKRKVDLAEGEGLGMNLFSQPVKYQGVTDFYSERWDLSTYNARATG